MKKINKSHIFSFILGVIITASIVGVSATILYSASEIGFTPTNPNWNVDNLESAINDLYNNQNNNVSSDMSTYLTSIETFKDSNKMDEIISNSTYTNFIFNNNNSIIALDNSNPLVSNDTSKVIYNTQYDSTWSAASAVSGVGPGWTAGPGVSYKDAYVGYDFSTEVWVYKIIIGVSFGKQDTDYVIEASNDNVNYTILKDGLHQDTSGDTLNGTIRTIIPNNYNTKYRYYRVRFLSEIAQSGSGNTVLKPLKFYAK